VGTTTFTGPIRAGNIINTSGTTVGRDIANVGYAVMVQKAAVTQSATAAATSIVIPANSMIISIRLLVSVVWSGTANITVGTSATATELVNTAVATATIGVVDLTSGANKPALDLWANTGTSDDQIFVKSGAPGATPGSGTLIVTYAQAINV